MKTLKFNLNFDFAKDKSEVPDKVSDYIGKLLTLALKLRFKDGLSMESQRKLFKILDKFDHCADNAVDLEDAEFELIDDAFKNAKFAPDMNKVLCQVYDFIDEAKQTKA